MGRLKAVGIKARWRRRRSRSESPWFVANGMEWSHDGATSTLTDRAAKFSKKKLARREESKWPRNVD